MPVRAYVLLAALGVAGTAAAADWPQWRGPNRDDKSAETGLLRKWPASGPKLLWSVEQPDKIGTGYGSPAVVGDKLFVLGAADESKEAPESVSCLNTKDGSQVWKTPVGTAAGSFKLQGWGRGPRSTPTVDGEFVYVLGVMGDLACFQKADGKVVWHKNIVKDFGGDIPGWGYSESPLVDGDQIVCTPGSKGGMMALSKKTGDLVWQCKDIGDAAGYSSTIVADVGGVRQYIQQTMKNGIGVRAKDGKLLWKAGEIKRATAVIPTPVFDGTNVFFTAGYGAGCELYKLEKDGADGTKATKVYSGNKVVVNHHGGVIQIGDYVYGHSDTKGWVCFEYKKGGDDPVWSSGKLGKGSVTFADGNLYCYSEDKGTMALVKATPDGWEEQSRFSIPKLSTLRPKSGRVWPHPVVANGKLYLRDYELLYCFDVGSPAS